ncbi:hypothetical protein [Phyllobacterium phragmitis]|nr:hypothetical protein [Phyllobacterium phragmitis]
MIIFAIDIAAVTGFALYDDNSGVLVGTYLCSDEAMRALAALLRGRGDVE